MASSGARSRPRDRESAAWRPGSFTKNFSWTRSVKNLSQLHQSIVYGFGGELRDVPRAVFRRRIQTRGRPDLIPINFFLFNKVVNGVDVLIADELVYQALTSEHSVRFDQLALFTFNYSFAGKWQAATPDQRWPALWAFHYVKDRVAAQLGWSTDDLSADDIQMFIKTDKRYTGQTSRKLATNLNFLYLAGRLSSMASPKVERWWVDALFLALDRAIEDRKLDGRDTPASFYANLLEKTGFHDIAGRPSLEKRIAAQHLVSLYEACGARSRFSEEQLKDLHSVHLSELTSFIERDERPFGAVDPTNPRVIKSVTQICALLAKQATNFEILTPDQLSNFDPDDFIRQRTRAALERIRNIRPNMSAEELMKLVRDQ